jgi:hypothetical protein
MLELPVKNNPTDKRELNGMLHKAAPAIYALTMEEGNHEIKRMTSVGVDMADLTNDMKDLRLSNTRASDLAGAGNGSMDSIDVMNA